MNNAKALQELVQIARDGVSFYTDASTEVKDIGLKSTFARMIEAKRDLIASLSTKLVSEQETVPDSGTFSGKLRQLYTDIRANIGSSEEKVYVAQLEEVEDRLLEHYESAIAEIDDPIVLAMLKAHLSRVRDCHAEMRSLKLRFAA
jgi:uncharacterized protein (TIGR02284 family)